jgi:hypothetical protein
LRRRPTLLRSVSSPSKPFRRTGRFLSPGPFPPRRWGLSCRSIPVPSTSRACFQSGVPPLGVSAGARAPVGFPRPRPSPSLSVAEETRPNSEEKWLPGTLVSASG